MSVDLLIRKTFLEQGGMRFGDMFAGLTDFFKAQRVNLQKYQSISDSDGSFVSVMSMGVFAMLKVYTGVERMEKEQLLQTYLVRLCYLIRTTDYMRESNSLVNYIKSLMGEIVVGDNPFREALHDVHDWFGSCSFHDDYFILLALVTLAFYQTQPDHELKEEWQAALQCMVDMDHENGFYDDGHSRVLVAF
jgi:hypothetical protein